MSPLPCTACDGSGEVTVRSSRCRHFGPGRCYCGGTEVSCDHCQGSGFEPCIGCDGGHAVVLIEGDPQCSACAAELAEV